MKGRSQASETFNNTVADLDSMLNKSADTQAACATAVQCNTNAL